MSDLVKRIIKMFQNKNSKLEYSFVGNNDRTSAICSANWCPCNNEIIPRGKGYIVVMEYNGLFSSKITCEKGARLMECDLKIAHEDAKYWWETGFVPLRATPTNKNEQVAPYDSSYDSQLSNERQNRFNDLMREENRRRYDAILGESKNKE